MEEGDVVDVVAGESSEDGGEVCVCVGETSGTSKGVSLV